MCKCIWKEITTTYHNKRQKQNSVKGYDTENAQPNSMISVSDSGWTKQAGLPSI